MDDLLLYNVIGIIPNHEDFAVSEILRQHREVGLDRFLVSLSFHPQMTPASNLIPVLCRRFAYVRDAVAGHGIELAVLIQSTVGHGWNGKVPLTEEPWQKVVYVNGQESPRMCHYDEGFRKYVYDCIAAISRERPSLLLIDDDVGVRMRECFCPKHIEALNKALGVSYSREDYEKLCSPSKIDDPVFAEIAVVFRDICVDFAKVIRSAVDSVDPTIRCGLCCCYGGYFNHAEVAKALAGNTEPFIRINNAVYGNKHPDSLVSVFRSASRVLKQIEGIDTVLDETDTCPHNYMSESAAMFHSHITNAMLSGFSGCKLWTSEFKVPVNKGSQARYEKKLRDYRGFYGTLNKLAKEIVWQGVSGLAFKLPDTIAGHPTNSAWGISGNISSHCIEGMYALPLRYEDVDVPGISFLRASDVVSMKDEQLRLLLSNKVVVDSLAAREVCKRGMADLIGVNADEGDRDFFFSSEQNSAGTIDTAVLWEESNSYLKPLSDKVEILSYFCKGQRFIDAYRAFPGSTYYRNPLGGEIVVLGWSLDVNFFKMYIPSRRDLLLEALDRLSNGIFEMAVESGEQSLVRHGILKDGSELLAVTQLGLDDDDTLLVRMKRTPIKAELLQPNGSWSTVDFSRKDETTVCFNVRISPCNPVALRLSF